MGNRYHIYANDEVDEKLDEIKPILKQKYGDKWKAKLWKFGIDRFAEEYKDVEKRIEDKKQQIEDLAEELETLKQHHIEKERREVKEEKRQRLQKLKKKRDRLEEVEGMSEEELRSHYREKFLEMRPQYEGNEEKIRSYVDRKVESDLEDKKKLGEIQDEIEELKTDLNEIENGGKEEVEISNLMGEGGLFGSV